MSHDWKNNYNKTTMIPITITQAQPGLFGETEEVLLRALLFYNNYGGFFLSCEVDAPYRAFVPMRHLTGDGKDKGLVDGYIYSSCTESLAGVNPPEFLLDETARAITKIWPNLDELTEEFAKADKQLLCEMIDSGEIKTHFREI